MLAAGGYLIQLLPGAGEDTISKVEGSILPAGSVTGSWRWITTIRRPCCTGPVRLRPGDSGTHPIEYRCYCSRDGVTRALISMGREELRALIEEQGQAELTCQFCDRVYPFTKGGAGGPAGQDVTNNRAPGFLFLTHKGHPRPVW